MLSRVARRRHPEVRQRQLRDDRRQFGAHVVAVRVALRGIACGRTLDQLVEGRRNTADHRAGPRHIGIQALVGDRQCGVAGKRDLAGEQLISHDAGRVDVATRAGVPVSHLLRRQVGGGAENDAGGGDSGLREGAHQTEVDDLDVALVGDQHVLRFHIAVHQAGAVRGRQPAEHRPKHRGDGMGWHRAALGQQLAKRATFDQLHDQERMSTVDALVVDRDEPGILEPGNSAGLHLESGQELLVTGVAGVHHLQRYRPVQPRVESAVHRRRAAGRDLGRNAVAPVQHCALGQVVSHAPIVGGAASAARNLSVRATTSGARGL